MKTAFEIIEHPADVGFRAYGATLEELFANSALAMLSLGCALEGVEPREQREIVATGADVESLLYAWLAEILAIGDAEQLVFCRADVSSVVTGQSCSEVRGEVRGVVYGEKFDRQRHRAGTYIKAVTYHQLCVEPIASGLRAQVFLDV
jgi:SHS2 domain-containing protein